MKVCDDALDRLIDTGEGDLRSLGGGSLCLAVAGCRIRFVYDVAGDVLHIEAIVWRP